MWVYGLVAILSFLCAWALIRRYIAKNNLLIFSAIWPRAYLCGVALYSIISQKPAGPWESTLMLGVASSLGVELINHIGMIRFPYMNGRIK